MKRLTAAEVASNFKRVLDGLGETHEEVVVTRNQRMVARIIPEPPEQNALEFFGDPCGKANADDLTEAVKTARRGKGGTLDELRNPWAY